MKEEWLEWIKGNIFSVVFGGMGLVLMGVGLVKMVGTAEPQEVEIKLVDDEVVGTVVVDVAGAVQNPGGFKMDEGVRVADALVAAGGLVADADRDWVARFINQAEPVSDGMKVIIPLEGERESVSNESVGGGVAGVSAVNVKTRLVKQIWMTCGELVMLGR